MKCCSGVRLREHLGAERLLADALGEVADDVELDVGLEQRQAHVADRVLDVALGDLAVTAKTLDGLFELVAEGVEHTGGKGDPDSRETRYLPKGLRGVNAAG